MRDRLRPDGVLVLNAGHPSGQDGFEKVLSATIGEVFPYVMRDPIKPTNTLIVASRAPLSDAGLARAQRAAGAAWHCRLARARAAAARAATSTRTTRRRSSG